jgi:hypothetical protein
MNTSPIRLFLAIITAAAGIYCGIALARYSEADDAPGGVLIAGLLMLGSVALAYGIARGGFRKSRR